jgi:predicted amidophosphoribosyltransferase
MIGHGYTVLKKWKLHRGPLFDRQILRLSLKQLDCLQKFEAEAIVPIPRQFHRSWKMRGNPAEIVARRLAKHLKLPLKDILTLAPLGELQKQQAQSSLGERLLNRESRFCTQSPLDPPPNRLILVDDFMTTGRTLNEAAKVLRRFGTQRIHAHILGVRALLSSSISNSNSNSNGSKYNQFN